MGNVEVDRRVEAEASAGMEIVDVVRSLQENLGLAVTAWMVGVGEPEVRHWTYRLTEPQPAAVERLLAAHQAFRLVQESECLYTARAWMIGMNTRIRDVSPVEAIAQGHGREAVVAARAYRDCG